MDHPSSTLVDDEVLEFEPESDDLPEEPPRPVVAPWRILVADDDPEVHRATELALSGVSIFGRRLALTSALSAAEGLEILRRSGDGHFALGLVDVVMETADAGLRMVQAIREELGYQDIRLVLRTGQPGLSPEQRIVEQYDIEEYRLKTELSKSSLVNTMTALLRGYAKLRRIREQAATIAELSEHNAALLQDQGGPNNQADENFLTTLVNTVLGGVAALITAPRGIAWLTNGAFEAHEPTASWGVADPSAHQSLLKVAQDAFDPKHAVTVQWSSSLGYYAPLHLKDQENDNHLLVLAYGAQERPSDDRCRALEAFSHSAQNAFDARLMMKRLKQLAYTDLLTGLPNRRRFGQLLDEEIRGLPASGEQIAVLMIDLDRFRQYNEAELGNRGDRVLEAAARHLRELAARPELVSRIGGDEFGVIFRGATGTDLLQEARHLFGKFSEPITVDDLNLELAASAGFAEYDSEVSDGAELIRRANSALYQGKQESRGSITAYESHGTNQKKREKVVALKTAIDSDQLVLFFQPKVSLRDRRLHGFEALIRWILPDGKILPPDGFLPTAQSAGLMREIDEWVARTALKQLRTWAEAGFVTSVAVNVAPHSLLNESFQRHLIQVWDAHPKDQGSLTLEIVEDAALSNFRRAVEIITDFRDRGLKVALDDFGTGYSSLSYLRGLPLNELKIDQTFVREMEKNTLDFDIVSSITSLARTFELTSIAEGVETTQIALKLWRMECDIAQGYGIARPMPADKAFDWAKRLHDGELLTDWVWTASQ